jgi:hypothetical protein
MSDVAQNALRYSNKNTRRSDPPNPHNGENINKNTVGFDCSGFVCHVIIESGYRINYESTGALLKSKAFTEIKLFSQVQAGDIILFSGHAGIVIEYDNAKFLGRFIHMSGKNNDGDIKISYFITTKQGYKEFFKLHGDNLLAPDGSYITYGTNMLVSGFRRIKSDRYSAEIDLHVNGSNPNPTLSPLGTSVYSKYLRKQQKEAADAIQTKSVPRYKTNIKTKSVPFKKASLRQLLKYKKLLLTNFRRCRHYFLSED